MEEPITKEKLRIAIGNALLTLNKDTLKELSHSEKLTMNKVALRLIRNIFDELNITDWKENGKKKDRK